MFTPNWFYALLRLLVDQFVSHRDAQIRFHQAQIQILQDRLSGNRIILKSEDIHPTDRRQFRLAKSETSWQSFVRMHINTLVACDFFCKTILTPLGKKTAYSLVFIHLGSRKVFATPSIYHPTEQWMKLQARNISIWLKEHRIRATHLIRDRDGKYPGSFDRFFQVEGIEIIKTPARSPNVNVFCEAWIGSLKRECLNYFLCFSLKHFDFIIHHYEHYYNELRPHQSIGNRPLKLSGQASA